MGKPALRRLDDPYHRAGPARATGHLEREGGHRIYYEDAGAEGGLPVVLCHGGPGGSGNPGYRRFVDSGRCRIVQFDQRGCGKSEPVGVLEGNTLQASIADMEALREHLGIARWLVGGGSWGSTLALAYAEAHPERTIGLLLISLWLCRQQDMDWWFQGVRTIFPELWEEFAALAPEEERHDLRRAYHRMIMGDDPELAAEAGRRLYLYEEGFMHFDVPLQLPDESRGPAYGRMFAHYAANDYFLRENQLLDDCDRLGDMPVILVTGRYDMCTTADNAFDLARCLPNADLRIVSAAGHYPTEKNMSLECVRATRDLVDRAIARESAQ
jgi:proline iminopeptidase